MKRTLSFMVMALALLLTQCRKPEVKFPSPVAPEGTTVSMTVTAGPGSKTDITAAGAITWSTGDKLYVGFDGKYVGCLELVNGGSATGTFTGNVTLPTGTTDGGKEFRFFYLGSNAPADLTPGESTEVTVSFATQTGLRENLGSCHIGYGTAQGTVAGSKVTGINVTLVSKVALACFSFKKSGTSEGYSGALTLSGNNICNSMTVNFNGTFSGATTGDGKINLTNTTTSEKYVMLVPPANVAEEILNFGGEYEGFTELAQGIEANKFYGRGEAIVVNLTKAPVPVTGVELNKSTLSLEVGADYTLTATVAPADATNKEVAWESSDESVATVADGTVTAVAEGSATITVTTEDGGKKATCAVTVTAPAPTIGTFTVAAGTTVEFSRGNLYYNGADADHKMNQNLPSGWNFYGHQYDCYASGTSSVTEQMEINLFTWSYGDWSKVYNTVDYAGTFTDWGTALGLPGAGEGKSWRTLSKAEWDYLLNTGGTSGRTDANRFAKAKVEGVVGLLIFPDGYNGGEAIGTITGVAALNTTTAAYPEEDILGATWTSMESSGVVFLPAAGERDASDVTGAGTGGYYWSSDRRNMISSYYLYFAGHEVSLKDAPKSAGLSVRLVSYLN